VTNEMGLKHYFTFDEAWEFMTFKRMQRENFRKGITTFDMTLRSIPGAIIVGEEVDKLNPVKHTFAGGCYIREIYNPKGELIVTKIHKVTHLYFLLKGEMSILTESGPKRIKAPYWGVTVMGTKRIIYTHEECIFITVHATKQVSVEAAEEEIVAKDFGEVEELEAKKEAKSFIDIVAGKE